MLPHLHVHSGYSFLDGAASVRALVERAAELGLPALALTDHDTVAGAPELWDLGRRAGVKPIQGAEVTVAPLAGSPAPDGRDRFHLVLLATGPKGYANLCRILTDAHLQGPRGRPLATPETLEGRTEGLIALTGCRRGEVPHRLLLGDYRGAEAAVRRLVELFGRANVYLELQADCLPGARRLRRAMRDLAEHLGLGLVATGDVHYLDPEDFPVHDLLTCVRLGITVEEPHPERHLNDRNYLLSPRELAEAFRDLPEALRGARELAERCAPAFELGRRDLPVFPLPEGEDLFAFLRRRVYQGARARYGRLGPEVEARLEHELALIRDLGYEGYFLLVWDVVRWARAQGIRCAGRGSAADSAVAYALGITDVDPVARGLPVERFMSRERAELPDIDVDVDHRHRDRVAEYVYRRYGEGRVAGVCTFHTFRGRQAIRDLGKALGVDAGVLDRLAKRWYGDVEEEALERFDHVPELRDAGLDPRRLEELLRHAARVQGLPRHVSTHLGGLLITRRPLWETTPLWRSAKGPPIAHFDKRGAELLGLLKLDLLPLRTLAAVEDAIRIVRRGHPDFDDARIPLDDAATYARIRRADTVGVFQLESPAQRALHPRLQADRFEDLVASVALIRPGPIQGDMVTPFLRRRRGEEPVTYPDPRLRPVLEKTYGVILYQEQVIQVATVIAGFTPGEADELRRVMTHARSHREMEGIGKRFVEKAIARGISPRVAEDIFACIKGYASYGFSEGHAAAFARHAYLTAYLLEHFPAAYYAALLSHQPMGYYPPRTLAHEARRRGIRFLPPDVNRSEVPFTLEGEDAIRIGLGAVKGLGRGAEAVVEERRRGGPYRDLVDLARRLRGALAWDAAANLSLAGALDGLEPNRRSALWLLRRLWQADAGGAEAPVAAAPVPPPLPDFTPWEKHLLELELLGLDAHRGHAFETLRPRLRAAGILSVAEAKRARQGQRVRVAGLAIRPHRPPTRSGRLVAYFTLEDETGLLDVTVFEEVYRRDGAWLFGEAVPPLVVTGAMDFTRGTNLVAAGIKPYLSQPMPSRSRSNRCGSGGSTRNLRYGMSLQSRSGGGGGMHTSG